MAALSVHEALSGISGSISLACWIFLLVPQLIENYKLKSAEGVSLAFICVWFIGDVTNLLGALGAGLVPTVVALAVYFCLSDVTLLTQCLYYNYINSKGTPSEVLGVNEDNEATQPLINRKPSDIGLPGSRRRSSASRRRLSINEDPSLSKSFFRRGLAQIWIRNAVSVIAVFAVGTAGWAVAWQIGLWKPVVGDETIDTEASSKWAVALGYVSAICYLGARIPQIIKNFRERSCEGLAMLFFILSLAGNLTYGGGILFHSLSKEYILTNLPWLIGSLGTIGEDIIIFIQFRMYRDSRTDQAIQA